MMNIDVQGSLPGHTAKPRELKIPSQSPESPTGTKARMALRFRMSKLDRRFARLAVVATVGTMALVGGTLALTSSPAFALDTVYVNASLVTGSSADFSYTTSGQQMARNIDFNVNWLSNGTTAYTSWRDVTNPSAPSPWTNLVPATVLTEFQGLPESTLYGQITNIPNGDCGHLLEIQVQGQDHNYATGGTNPAAGATTIVDNCGPALTAGGNTFYGDGFMPGESNITVVVQNLDSGAVTSSQVVSASTEMTRFLGCTRTSSGFTCYAAVLQAPGVISGTTSSQIGCDSQVTAEVPQWSFVNGMLRRGWHVLAQIQTMSCLR
jgi:hypothetical protein